jgi:hypothetical protein
VGLVALEGGVGEFFGCGRQRVLAWRNWLLLCRCSGFGGGFVIRFVVRFFIAGLVIAKIAVLVVVIDGGKGAEEQAAESIDGL